MADEDERSNIVTWVRASLEAAPHHPEDVALAAYERGLEEGRRQGSQETNAESYDRGYAAGGIARSGNLEVLDEDAPSDPYDPDVQAKSAKVPPDTSILDLGMTVRSTNCLIREGLSTIRAVLGRPVDDLLDIIYLGEKALEEIRQKFRENGYTLRGDDLAV